MHFQMAKTLPSATVSHNKASYFVEDEAYRGTSYSICSVPNCLNLILAHLKKPSSTNNAGSTSADGGGDPLLKIPLFLSVDGNFRLQRKTRREVFVAETMDTPVDPEMPDLVDISDSEEAPDGSSEK